MYRKFLKVENFGDEKIFADKKDAIKFRSKV
jgi:hypothetical protein